MKIERLQIKNFRGIQSFEHNFGQCNLVCFVGRGNSTKSTILEAVALCLSPRWTANFSDADFYNCDITKSIEISVTISDIPEKLVAETKYGLYIRLYDPQSGGFFEDDSPDHELIPTLTINLNVNETLEPEWNVINENIEPKSISARDREQLGVFLISDYSDHHFSWSKGSPLYSLQTFFGKPDSKTKDVVLEVVRKAIEQVEEQGFQEFDDVLANLKENVSGIGGDLSDGRASVDIKDMAFRSNTISLHRENRIPLRMDGKGTKRLVSIAMQKLLVKYGGIILVDEIEQGLEPDRVKHLVRTLQSTDNGQIFITTHSSNVVEELEARHIFHVKNNKGVVSCSNKDAESFQALYRACPEAVYANRVILCEGKTEIGIVRAYDKLLTATKKGNLASKNIIYTDGSGASVFNRALALNGLSKKVILICDSDDKGTSTQKQRCIDAGITALDWEEGLDIEHQVFKDLDWDGVKELVKVGSEILGEKNMQGEVKKRVTDWDGNLDSLNTELGRKALADVATMKNSSWFKTIGGGEKLGGILFKGLANLGDDKQLKQKIQTLIDWIEGDE